MDFTRRKLLCSSALIGSATAIGLADLADAASPPLKVGFAYLGTAGDGGWTQAHDIARRSLETNFGPRISTMFVEQVDEGAGAERVFRDLVAQGNRLIFGTSFGYGQAMQRVAMDHPEVFFEHATGYKTAPNLRVYQGRFYEITYMAGVIAGHMTKSELLGFVGAVPIPEVLRNLNAFLLGARSVNPRIKLKVVWINSWFDPPKEGEAAESLLNAGADVLLQSTDSTAVLQAAARRGKYAFGWDSDMSAVSPGAHLASCVLNWLPYYEKCVNDVLTHTWKTGSTIWGTRHGMNDMVKVAPFVPASARAKVQEIRSALKAGTFDVFKGPLIDSGGRTVLAAGKAADDTWMAGINFYVDGIQGTPPR